MSDQQTAWTGIAQLLRAQLTESVWYSTFCDAVPVVNHSSDEIVIKVPNTLAHDRIMTRYRGLITDAMSDLGMSERTFSVIVDDITEPAVSEPPPPVVESSPPPIERDPQPTAPTPATTPTPHNGINPRYTFETFVQGSGNRFTAAAALRVAEQPAASYNPLLIYGAAGLGKTHLLHAIGHYVNDNYRHHVVRYASTETFINEFVDAIRSDSMTSLRNRYRNIDVLLLDDIQFLQDKERTQEEFFHTFNALHGANKQIVLTSDRMPDALPALEERLRGRFRWGLITDIQPPDLETRLAILRNKAERERVEVPLDTLEFIASKITTNIRELEGALIRVTAYASLSGEPITTSLAKHQLADLLAQTQAKPRTHAELLDDISKILGYDVDALKGKSRRKPLVTARHIAMYVVREKTDLSYPAIAKLFGGRDHTTVISAVRKIETQMKERQAIYQQVRDVLQKLQLS